MKLDLNAVGFGFYAVNEREAELYEKILACDYANVLFAYGSPEDIARQAGRIKEHGKTCWIGAFDYAFRHRDGETTLQAEFPRKLAELVRTLEEAGVYDAVRGIYFDEPCLHRISKEDIRRVTSAYRELSPGKGAFICFSVTPLCPDLWSPDYPVIELDEYTCEYLTDISFDFYDDYEENRHWYDKLVEKMYEVTKNLNLRYWFVPNTMSYKGRSDENESIIQTNALLRYLKASPNPGGMMCYSYYTFPPEVENLGNINLDILLAPENPDRWSRLEARLMEIGRGIVSGGLHEID